MKMKKRLFVLLLAAVMALTCLTGCKDALRKITGTSNEVQE